MGMRGQFFIKKPWFGNMVNNKGNITSELIFQNREFYHLFTHLEPQSTLPIFSCFSLKIQSIIETTKKSQISITSEKEAIWKNRSFQKYLNFYVNAELHFTHKMLEGRIYLLRKNVPAWYWLFKKKLPPFSVGAKYLSTKLDPPLELTAHKMWLWHFTCP